MSDLTEEQIKEFREAFDLFDKDGDQTITTAELLTVMRSLGHNPSNEELMQMIREVDINGNGKIEFNEFLALMEKNLRCYDSEELIRGAFEVIDLHGDGYITYQQLRQVVHDLGLDYTEDEMRDMIAEADTSGEGRVNYHDFLTVMTNNL
ncbi:calmodulin-A-like [Dreissena polymorpha]|uniref:EF-hand domain-containing protein n=1 Tax=Dreissena polymorpha TaxID=45954 RepID=A0A9D4R4M9_DREPO|nr:calmodulin-A-like [Dreissena polymorpha]KAH3854083.1 hypothetical protein DPMN_096622 [Dreissena polymorpha]